MFTNSTIDGGIPMRIRTTLCLITALVLCGANLMVNAEVPLLINYQGILLDSEGQPMTMPTDGIFTIYNDPVMGDSLWAELRTISPGVNGTFNLVLGEITPIESNIFSGPDRWIGVRVGGDYEMVPRARLVAVGYSYRVATVDGATGGTISGNLIITVPDEDTVSIGGGDMIIRGQGGDTEVMMTSSGMTYTGTGDAITITEAGGEPQIVLSVDASGPSITLYEAPSLSRSAGPDQVAPKIIFRDGGVLLIAADGPDTVCQLLPNGNIIGTGKIAMGTNHATTGDFSNIFGYDNEASGDSAVVCGGYQNSASGAASVICGGGNNTATSNGSFIGGGYLNESNNYYCVVGGGYNNATGDSGVAAVVGGGIDNDAGGSFAVIGGGANNYARGIHSVIPGGYFNRSMGFSSFAAGRYAEANHDRTFVFSDGGINGYVSFASTDERQFLINAGNGVGINTNSPTAALHVNGEIRLGQGSNEYHIREVLGADPDPWCSYISSNGIAIGNDAGTNRQMFMFTDGVGSNNVFTVATSENSGSSWQADFVIQQNGRVGIGTTSPGYPLQIDGGTDASLSGGGWLTVGPTTSNNITIDNNEIMARNNGAAASLNFNSGSGDVFMCNGGGDVGIGDNSASYQLDVNGDIECTTLHETSDVRFKKDISSITDALTIVSDLRGVKYAWDRDAFPNKGFDEYRHLGLIAQEVQSVLPEAVVADKQGYMSVNYSHLTPLLIEAVKDLKAENDQIKSEQVEKSAQIEQLQTQIAEMQAVLNQLIKQSE